MRLRVSTFVLALATLTLPLTSHEAGAQAAPAVEVDPDPVVAGVDVTVRATFNSSGDTYLIAQCRAGADVSNIGLAANDCAIRSTGALNGTELTATVDFPYFFFTFNGGRVQCDVEPCEVAVASGTGGFPFGTINEVAVAPLEFFAEMRGETSFRPGSAGSVYATVFGTAEVVEAVQCTTSRSRRACVAGEEFIPGGTGVSVDVQRFIQDGDDFVDCMSEPCGIGLRATGIDATANTQHYLRPLTVLTPRILGGGWTSDVPTTTGISATGLHERTWGSTAWQCVESLIDEPFDPAAACGATDAPSNPGFSTEYDGVLTAVRMLDVGGTLHDCSVVACVVVTSGWFSPDQVERTATYTRPLRYRTVVYIWTGSVPGAGYWIGENLRLFANSYLPEGGVWEYAQCVGTPSVATRGAHCEQPRAVGPDSQGNGAFVDAPVKSVISTDSGPVRCRAEGCSAMISYTPPGGVTEFVLHPIRLREQLVVSDTTDLLDGQSVDVEEIGVLDTIEGAGAWVMQCGANSQGPRKFVCANVGTVEPDHGGHFVGSINVQRSLVADDVTVSCDADPCALALVSIGPDGTVLSARGIRINIAHL